MLYEKFLYDPDTVLMLDFQKGNKASFENLMRKYYSRIFNLCYKIFPNREIAEKLAQAVFEKINKGAKSYKVQLKFRTWIYMLTKNFLYKEVRSYKEKMSVISTAMISEERFLHKQVKDSKLRNTREVFSQREISQWIQAALQSLPIKQRIAIVLFRFEKFSFCEIAQILRCSEKNVKLLIRQAKGSLRIQLGSVFKGFSARVKDVFQERVVET